MLLIVNNVFFKSFLFNVLVLFLCSLEMILICKNVRGFIYGFCNLIDFLIVGRWFINFFWFVIWRIIFFVRLYFFLMVVKICFEIVGFCIIFVYFFVVIKFVFVKVICRLLMVEWKNGYFLYICWRSCIFLDFFIKCCKFVFVVY